MAVVAIKPYIGNVRDKVENFHGNALLYIGWEDHLFFCSPYAFAFPPSLIFGTLLTDILPDTYGVHPDWSKIDWSQAQWFKSGQAWVPDASKSLAENGLKHKDVLRFRTPGLTGIKGSFS